MRTALFYLALVEPAGSAPGYVAGPFVRPPESSRAIGAPACLDDVSDVLNRCAYASPICDPEFFFAGYQPGGGSEAFRYE
jgi:hypothetical protein